MAAKEEAPTDMGKDSFISSLFRAPVQSQGPRIQDLSLKDDEIPQTVKPEEGKSLLELMVEEQQKAKSEKEKVKAAEKAKVSQNIGSGFKKGFLGSSAPKKSTTTSTVEQKQKQPQAASAPKKSDSSIPTITPQAKRGDGKAAALVLPEVQNAMQMDENNSTVQALKQGGKPVPMSIIC